MNTPSALSSPANSLLNRLARPEAQAQREPSNPSKPQDGSKPLAGSGYQDGAALGLARETTQLQALADRFSQIEGALEAGIAAAGNADTILSAIGQSKDGDVESALSLLDSVAQGAGIGELNLVDGSQDTVFVSAPEGGPNVPSLEVRGADLRAAGLGLSSQAIVADPATVDRARERIGEIGAGLRDAAGQVAVRREFAEALSQQFDGTAETTSGAELDDDAALAQAANLGKLLGSEAQPITLGNSASMLGLFR